MIAITQISNWEFRKEKVLSAKQSWAFRSSFQARREGKQLFRPSIFAITILPATICCRIRCVYLPIDFVETLDLED